MKILFITKPYVIDPLGIAYLSAALKARGHEVELFRTTDEENDTYLYEDIYNFKPDVLAYSVYTGSHKFYTCLNANIRRILYSKVKNPPISVFGGPHCTLFEEIKREPFVDVIYQGECDHLLPDTIKSLLDRRWSLPLIFKAKENPQDLDALPFPDRQLIYKFPENADNPIKNIMTSRGCPFSCPYCYNSVFNKMFAGKKIRYRSIPSVIEEAKQLIKDFPRTKFIFFEDDEFAMHLERVKEFTKAWKAEVDIPFHVQLRVDLLNWERISLLKEAGCVSVTFAIESGVEERRRNILKRQVSNESILHGAALLRKAGILFRTENMICQPGETLYEALETLDMNIACKPTIGWASLFQPYPKTPMGEDTIKMGLFDGGLEDIPSSFFERSVLKIPEKEKQQFENLQRLFGLICNFPILRPLVPWLIKVPPNKLYNFLYKWWKNKRYNLLYNCKRRVTWLKKLTRLLKNAQEVMVDLKLMELGIRG